MCVCVGGNSLCVVWGRFSLSGFISPLLPEKSYLTANLCYLLDSLVALPIAVRCGKYLHRQVRGSCRVVVVIVFVVVVVVIVVVVKLN